MRDMTERQFKEALERHGMKDDGFMGYVSISLPSGHGSVSVCRFNAGSNRRAQLAYLLDAKDKHSTPEELKRVADAVIQSRSSK